MIGHIKADHRMDRNYLKGRDDDRINAVLAAAGYNFAPSSAGSKPFGVPCSGCSPEQLPHLGQADQNRSAEFFTGD